ncbi:hypothetical protein PFICI_02303 [Pestalotiopsis fici W106-1]|uniref:AAA+ ATPase domain-containing protein n=1 Tax=Pestalotiopsis fici (strain W106-1 / CGMCC3.15140) TaxID=1229662 RepID=W3XDW9_PESFW|nr:uncharacterized protein PFICI_02303 [Pestalotiopsis fici W106-1]ETS84278.1 hypothetical protein PFICI_02303 [Pestalotiopsis fici W106-1]
MGPRRSARIALTNIRGTHRNASLVPTTPEWFIDHCVRIVGEVSDKTLSLVSEHELGIAESVSTDYQEHKYMLPSIMYESIQSLVYGTSEARSHFGLDFLQLVFPLHNAGGHEFLEAVVEHFANDIGADLVRLNLEDIKALAANFYRAETPEQGTKPPESIDYLEYFWGDNTQTNDRPQFPFADLLLGPAKKRASLNGHSGKELTASDENRPLVVHVPKVLAFSKAPLYRKIGKALQHAIKLIDIDGGRVLMIGSDTQKPCDCTDCRSKEPEMQIPDGEVSRLDYVLKSGVIPSPWAISLVPLYSESQRQLLDRDRMSYFQRVNICLLSKAIGSLYPAQLITKLRHPYLSLDFSNVRALKILGEKQFDNFRVQRIAQMVGDCSEPHRIEQAIVEFETWEAMLKQWQSQDEMKGWEKAPKHVREVISKVMQDDNHFIGERKLLNHIVRPDGALETWNSIDLATNIKRRVARVTDFKTGRSPGSHGLLKDSRIGGMLLYGPPGTGKTHLARVLATESGASMICISAADVTDKYVGETEKAIKALFNLGKMLFPSIIFIDEADGLLASRRASNYSWDHDKINQFLQEIDGLARGNKQPFLILATNHPECLDHAVLRRVPFKFYLGFPSRDSRHRILSIILREEQIGSDADLKVIADRTSQYTGSDLRSLCIEAAQLSEEEFRETDDGEKRDAKRVLKLVHFDKALETIHRSVPESEMSTLKRFAREFDPEGQKAMLAEAKTNIETNLQGSRQLSSLESSADSENPRKRGFDQLLNDYSGTSTTTVTTASASTIIKMGEDLISELPYKKPSHSQ